MQEANFKKKNNLKSSAQQSLAVISGSLLSTSLVVLTAKYSNFQPFIAYSITIIFLILGLIIKNRVTKSQDMLRTLMLSFLATFLSFQFLSLVADITLRLLYWELPFQNVPSLIIDNTPHQQSLFSSLFYLLIVPTIVIWLWDRPSELKFVDELKVPICMKEFILKYKFFVISAFAIITYFLVTGFYYWFAGEQPMGGLENLALFGDFFGGTMNPLLSFLALIALFYTINIQSRELALSRDELRNSADALTSQNATLKKQHFDSSFFEMLKMHNSLVDDIDITFSHLHAGANRFQGRDTFDKLIDVFNRRYEGIQNQSPDISEEDKIERTYQSFYSSHNPDLGHYFRYLYNLIKYIDRNSSELNDPRMYSNLVRAQLSDDEVVILFYNCLSSLGREKFKPLVEKYSLLKHLPADRLVHVDHKNFYEESAFT